MKEIKDQLNYFTGTTCYHRASPFFRKVVCTDGVMAMANLCKAHWLVNDLAMHIQDVLQKHEDAKHFQGWKFTVENHVGKLVGTDGNYNVYHTEDYDFTDFPLDEIEFFVEPTYMESEGNLMVLMLPNEH